MYNCAMTADSGSPAETTPADPNPAAPVDLAFWLKSSGIAVAAFALVGFLGAYATPREPEVTRSVDIAAPIATVFPLVADLRHLPDWSPFFAADPNVAIVFTGPLDGVGQAMTWESKLPQVGSGTETITASQPDSAVEMTVARAGRGPDTAWFKLEAKGETTAVTWGHRTDLGLNPVNRYMGLGIDKVVGPEYERGLARLKALAETPAKAQ